MQKHFEKSKISRKIIFNGQKRGWSFARKETSLQKKNSIGVDHAKKLFELTGGGEK